MQIEPHSPVNPTALEGDWHSLAPMDPPSGFHEASRWVANGKESLAIYSGSASLQRAMMELALDLYLNRQTANAAVALWNSQLFPMLVDESCFAEPLASLGEDRGKTRLGDMLRASLDAEPLEDGMHHPAEQIIEDALFSREGQHALGWLRQLSLDAGNPSFSAEVLRCLGRQRHPGTALWRSELVRDGLAMDSAEIREAAVRAAEWWGDPLMRSVLESHSEVEAWLEEYISDVKCDLNG